MNDQTVKPLGGKCYGSIGHLPGSRRGPADHGVNDGQCRICCERVRDKHDTIIVQEKLDGSCVGAAKIGGKIVALQRAGYPAITSPFEQHHLWAKWVEQQDDRFQQLLSEGERVVGEWIAQAHGTLYAIKYEPFVPFDLMVGGTRATVNEFVARVAVAGFTPPFTVVRSGSPIPIVEALELIGEYGHHGATEPVEGAVWRVERKGVVDFLAKYVKPGKVDGRYLPEVSGKDVVWNWTPTGGNQ